MSIPPFSQDFLNKYGLLRTLGEGSYGVVLLAKNKFLDKFVAIKALKELHADEALRFSRESKILASLEHPNIVRVFDAGVDGQIPYMTMEVVEGDTLDKVLESNPPDLKRSLEIIAQCGDAVAFAHERGIIHRDLKPQNCFQLRDGSIKLGDFGLAREIAGGNTITASSVLLGTPHYISVEQVRGERAGPASDQYALAVMAYQMVTGGRLPFEGDNLMAVITARITETPAPPSDHKPGLPPDVDAWIMKGLARAPENRFASVTEFVVEARRIIEPKKVITGAAVRTSGRISRPQTTTPGGVPGETMPAGAAPSAPGRVSAKSRPVQPRSSGQVSGSFNSVAAPLPTPLWRKLVAAGMVIAALALGVQGWSRRSLDRAVVTEGSPASATPTALPALDERVSELAKRLSHRAAQVDPEAIYRLLPIKGDLTSTLQQRNVTKEDQDRYVRQVLGSQLKLVLEAMAEFRNHAGSYLDDASIPMEDRLLAYASIRKLAILRQAFEFSGITEKVPVDWSYGSLFSQFDTDQFPDKPATSVTLNDRSATSGLLSASDEKLRALNPAVFDAVNRNESFREFSLILAEPLAARRAQIGIEVSGFRPPSFLLVTTNRSASITFLPPGAKGVTWKAPYTGIKIFHTIDANMLRPGQNHVRIRVDTLKLLGTGSIVHIKGVEFKIDSPAPPGTLSLLSPEASSAPSSAVEPAPSPRASPSDFPDTTELVPAPVSPAPSTAPTSKVVKRTDWEKLKGIKVMFRRDDDEMVLIPGGTVPVGTASGGPNDTKLREVSVPAFWMDQRLVTNARYRKYLQSSGAVAFRNDLDKTPPASWKYPQLSGDDQPVVGVTRRQAEDFAAWAGKRLPTGAEWEKAARGGLTGKLYPWGDEPPDGRACFGLSTRDGKPAPVGSFAPNGYELYDMAGNVAQWVSDGYDADRQEVVPTTKGANKPKLQSVFRGGGWNTSAETLRVAQWHAKEGWSLNVGFRCVDDYQDK